MEFLVTPRTKSKQSLRTPSYSTRNVFSRETAGSQLRLGPETLAYAKNKSQELGFDGAATWWQAVPDQCVEEQANYTRGRVKTPTPTWTRAKRASKNKMLRSITDIKQQRENNIIECMQLKKQILETEGELKQYKGEDKLDEWTDLKLEECSTVISSFKVLMLEHKSTIFQHPLSEKELATLSFIMKWKGAISDLPSERCDNPLELLNRVGQRSSDSDLECEDAVKHQEPHEEQNGAMVVEEEVTIIEKELAELDLAKAEKESEIEELKPGLEEARKRLRETPEFVCEQRNHVLTEEKRRLPAVQLRFVALERPDKKWRPILEDLVIEYANLPHAVVRCSAKNNEIVCELEVLEEHEAFEGARTLQALIFENALTPSVLENHVKFVGVGNLQVLIITPSGLVLYDRRGHAKRRPESDDLSEAASLPLSRHCLTLSDASSSAANAPSSRSSSAPSDNTDELDGEPALGRSQAAESGTFEVDGENGPFAMHPAYKAMLTSDCSGERQSASRDAQGAREKLADQNEKLRARTTTRAARSQEIVHVHMLWDHVAAAWGGPPIKAWFHLLVHRIASISAVLRVAQKYLPENDMESKMMMSVWKNVVDNANDDKGPQIDFMDVYPTAAKLLHKFCKRFIRRSGSLHGIEQHLITINSFFFTKKTFGKLCEDVGITGANEVFELLNPGNGRLFVEDFAFLLEFCGGE
eukprot:GEMP01015214.1.p1 GENE.GEMP01015214.1~~GEMP01015214.1.p1  ORF type:complete len:700 (+),score=177.37 GEMP01015214.1:204-2303(+)